MIVFFHFVNGADVRVVQGGGEACLALLCRLEDEVAAEERLAEKGAA